MSLSKKTENTECDALSLDAIKEAMETAVSRQKANVWDHKACRYGLPSLPMSLKCSC